MKTFLLISPKNRTVYNFRGDLIREIKRRGYHVHVTGPNYDEISKICELGVTFHLTPMQKTGTNPFSDVRYETALYNLCKAIKPDVVLSYTVKPVVYGCAAAHRADVPLIFAMITGVGYAFTSESIKAKMLRVITSSLYKRSLGFTKSVIFQNSDNLELFVRKGIVKREKCCLVAGSGVNTKHFYPVPLPNKISFFMLSRLLYSKGVREYLQAARIVKNRYPDIRFILLGDIQETPDALKSAELNTYLMDEIIEQYHETIDVRPYYEMSSVFVLPSYSEGLPRTVLEAMSMGRAIITTNVPGCKETVQSGVNGFLVEPKSVESLVEAMTTFIVSESSESCGSYTYLELR